MVQIYPPGRGLLPRKQAVQTDSEQFYLQHSLDGQVFIMRKYQLPQAPKAVQVNQTIHNQTHFCWTGLYRFSGFLWRCGTLRTIQEAIGHSHKMGIIGASVFFLT